MFVPWTQPAVYNASRAVSVLHANETEKCESIVQERAGSQRASSLFLYTHEMCVGLRSAIVLVASVSGASLRVNEGKGKRPAAAARRSCSDADAGSGLPFRTNGELNQVQVQAFICTIKTIKSSELISPNMNITGDITLMGGASTLTLVYW